MIQIAAADRASPTNSSKIEPIPPLVVHLRSKVKNQEGKIDEKPEKSKPNNNLVGKSSSQTESNTAQNRTINIGFHDRRELTRQPSVLYNVDLSELDALRTKLAGNLALVLYIDEYGEVVKIEGIPDDERIASEAQRLQSLLMALRFSPGEIEGRPVKFTMKIEIVLHEQENRAKVVGKKNYP